MSFLYKEENGSASLIEVSNVFWCCRELVPLAKFEDTEPRCAVEGRCPARCTTVIAKIENHSAADAAL